MCIFLVFNIIVPALMALKLWKTTRDEARGTASSVHVRGTLRLLLQTALVWAIAATAFITSQLDNTTSLPVAQVIRDSVQELVVSRLNAKLDARTYHEAKDYCSGCYHLRHSIAGVSGIRRCTSRPQEGSFIDSHACFISTCSCGEPVYVWLKCRQTRMRRSCINSNCHSTVRVTKREHLRSDTKSRGLGIFRDDPHSFTHNHMFRVYARCSGALLHELTDSQTSGIV
jgi:hypothetical protein